MLRIVCLFVCVFALFSVFPFIIVAAGCIFFQMQCDPNESDNAINSSHLIIIMHASLSCNFNRNILIWLGTYYIRFCSFPTEFPYLLSSSSTASSPNFYHLQSLQAISKAHIWIVQCIACTWQLCISSKKMLISIKMDKRVMKVRMKSRIKRQGNEHCIHTTRNICQLNIYI